MNKIVFRIGMVLAVLAVLTAPAVAQEYDVFHLVPVNSSCTGAGCTVTVWVMINVSQDNVNAAQASIIFDPNVVNVINVEEGTNPDWYFWDWQVYDYGADKKYVFIGAADLLNVYGPGELELGKMTLQCKTPGVSALHFGNESEVGSDRLTQVSGTEGVICGPTGNECTMEDGTFTCLAPKETFSKELVKGWNLISLPLTADNMTVANIIDKSLSGKYDALYRYDAVNKSWVMMDSSDVMENGVGYFIHMTSAGTWTYQGSAYLSMSVPLEQGLNMIGWLNCSKPIDNALSSIDGDYWYVARWNATAQKFEVYNPVAPPEFNDFTTMERGEGYFISMKSAETLTESC